MTDNTDLLVLRESHELTRDRLIHVILRLADFVRKYRDTACLGFTHYQTAQPTTVGKRACLWAHDLVLDLQEMEHRLSTLLARGTKGTTGTQASFLRLFDGDHAKVERLDALVSQKMGFTASYPVTGQTYSRKVDAQIVDTLCGVAQSAHKAATDLRLLQGRGELEEPVEADQVGSSAMAYKRNPMRSERICALSRYVMSLQSSAAQTAATQWLERTLDDSANRRPRAAAGVPRGRRGLAALRKHRRRSGGERANNRPKPGPRGCHFWRPRTCSWKRYLTAVTAKTCTSASAATAARRRKG